MSRAVDAIGSTPDLTKYVSFQIERLPDCWRSSRLAGSDSDSGFDESEFDSQRRNALRFVLDLVVREYGEMEPGHSDVDDAQRYADLARRDVDAVRTWTTIDNGNAAILVARGVHLAHEQFSHSPR